MDNFEITNDELAEWALGKIKEETEERDRLLALVDAKRQDLILQEQDIIDRCDKSTSFLRYKLQQYMGTVKCKSTKTQDSYQLLSGKLIRKKPSVDYKVDKDELVAWLMEHEYADLIKVDVYPMWGEVKKKLTGDPETGIVMISDTGEVVDGVSAALTEEKFDIKF